MYCSKENILLYLKNRIKHEKEVRDCCDENEKEMYDEITTVIETMEQLVKEIEINFH